MAEEVAEVVWKEWVEWVAWAEWAAWVATHLPVDMGLWMVSREEATNSWDPERVAVILHIITKGTLPSVQTVP